LEALVDTPSQDDPAARAFERVEAGRVLEAVHRLPPDQRDAVLLRLVSGLSSGEVGAVIGKSPGAGARSCAPRP